mgnify:CR=1 FL=1
MKEASHVVSFESLAKRAGAGLQFSTYSWLTSSQEDLDDIEPQEAFQVVTSGSTSQLAQIAKTALLGGMASKFQTASQTRANCAQWVDFHLLEGRIVLIAPWESMEQVRLRLSAPAALLEKQTAWRAPAPGLTAKRAMLDAMPQSRPLRHVPSALLDRHRRILRRHPAACAPLGDTPIRQEAQYASSVMLAGMPPELAHPGVHSVNQAIPPQALA